MSTDAIKKIAKFLSFKSFNASSPMICEILILLSVDFTGGVFGKVKLMKPRTKAAMPESRKVFFKKPCAIPSFESQ